MSPSPESGQTSRREYFLDLAVGALCLILGIALAAHAYVGLFTRYMADDYCTAATMRTAGLLQTQSHFYLGWSGRFSFTLTISIVELFGTRIVPYLPLAALICWLSAMTWACYQFLSPTLRRRRLLFSFFLAELIIFVTIADNKSGVYEALYWQTGMLTYVAPLILLPVFAGFAGRALRRAEDSATRPLLLLLLAAFAATFYAGGFSETYAALQLGLFLLAVAALLLKASAPRKRGLLPLVCAGLFGSVLAISVVALAPGNKVRESALPTHSDWLTILARSLSNAVDYAFFEHNYPGTIVLRAAALLLPAMLSLHLASQTRGGDATFKHGRRLAFIAASGFFLICCCFLPASYALSAMPPARALVTPQFVLTCTLALFGWTTGIAAGRRFASRQLPRRFLLDLLFAALALLLTLPVIGTTRQTFLKAEKARALARLWDRQDAEIRAQLARGERALTVPVVYNIGGTDLLKRDPKWYVNYCMAEFYGADSVTAVPEEEGSRIMTGEPGQ